MNEHRLCWVLYLFGEVPTGPARGFPGPLLGDGVDVVASPCGRVQVLLPQVHDLKRLLTWSRARRLLLRQTFLRLRVSVKRGVLPGQLGQIGLCRDLAGRKSKRGKENEREEKKRSREGEAKAEADTEEKEMRLEYRCKILSKTKQYDSPVYKEEMVQIGSLIFYIFLQIP